MTSTAHPTPPATERSDLPERTDQDFHLSPVGSQERLPFYWEYPDREIGAAYQAAYVEEGITANDINRGRLLLSLHYDYQQNPSHVSPPRVEANPKSYSGAIAAILQTAVHDGLDVNEICRDAVEIQAGIYNTSIECAQFRVHEGASTRDPA